MRRESQLVHTLLVLAGERGVKLFRNNVGCLQDRFGKYVHYGLAVGSPDLVGWVPHIVTPADVGRTVALFVGIEAKREDGGVVSEEQRKFLAALERDGAVQGVARSLGDLEGILGPWRATTTTSSGGAEP